MSETYTNPNETAVGTDNGARGVAPGELFADPGARAVWAAVAHLEEAAKHALLDVLAGHLAVPEARVNPANQRVARAVAALREAAALRDGVGELRDAGLSRDVYGVLRSEHTAAGWPSAQSICRWLGGTWNDALRRAGLGEVSDGDAVVRELGPAFTREECVQAVLDYVRDTGDPLRGLHAVLAWAKRPDVRERPGHRPRSLGLFQRLFDGWADVLTAAGLIDIEPSNGTVAGIAETCGPVRPVNDRGYSDEQLFAAMREIAVRLGRSPKTLEYSRERDRILVENRASGAALRAFPTYQAIHLRFRTWDEALIAAGLEPVRGRQCPQRRGARRRTRRIDDDLLGTVLREAYSALGEPFTSSAYSAWRAKQIERDRQQRRLRVLPHYVSYWQRWGNWRAALAAAGIRSERA